MTFEREREQMIADIESGIAITRTMTGRDHLDPRAELLQPLASLPLVDATGKADQIDLVVQRERPDLVVRTNRLASLGGEGRPRR